MVMKTGGGHLLWRKLLRDVRHNWKSFGAVFVICMLSTMLYCGIDGAWRGMEKNLDVQFAKSEMGGIWVIGSSSDRTARDIATLPGVLDAQRRVHVQAEADLPGDPTLELFMSDGPDRVSAPLIFEGNDLSKAGRNVCVLDSQFAQAFDLSIGDHLKLKAGGELLELSVGGIGYDPEYVTHSDGFDLSADPRDYGYAWISSGTLGHFAYQEIAVRTASGADDDKVKRDIQDLLNDPTMKVLTRDDKVGIKMAVEEVDQVRALGQVFPAVFFLVAALITFSTMKRLVDNQRLQIGTLCSLGYGKWQLIRHYMSYGLLVGVLGALFGLVGARFFLGGVVIWALQSIYTMPDVQVYLHPRASSTGSKHYSANPHAFAQVNCL
jgi:putative ABC transport system permease protein